MAILRVQIVPDGIDMLGIEPGIDPTRNSPILNDEIRRRRMVTIFFFDDLILSRYKVCKIFVCKSAPVHPSTRGTPGFGPGSRRANLRPIAVSMPGRGASPGLTERFEILVIFPL